jgi:outer membrane immunogenic protein
MKHLLLATTALAAVAIASQASAADLGTAAPAYTKAPAIDPGHDWSGFYIGANGGYGFGHQSISYTPNDGLANAFVNPVVVGAPAGTRLGSTDAFHQNGGLGGIQGGYNWSLPNHFMVGIEADFDGASAHGHSDSLHPFLTTSPTATLLTFALDQKLEWFGTLRGRIGFSPASNLLLFASGGLAYGHVVESATISSAGSSISAGTVGLNANCHQAVPCYVANGTRTSIGWAAGAGAEYALTRNITMRAEYLHVDLGKSSLTSLFNNDNPTLASASATTNFSAAAFDTVRFGVNYHFN